ncbi:MAG TPA: tyrosine-protein phosphatase [Gaiellaceae bacterium]|nr:tyrosine-protein phosphatase [Gaiellaceae bacterium]
MTRRLDWDGVLNVRDLGGVPLADGTETRYGELVRADNIGRMGPDGWRALAEHGVTRIVDLRWPEEIEDDPPRDVDVDVVNVSVFGDLDPDFDDPIDRYVPTNDAAGYFGWMYERAWETHRTEIANALAAIADAPPGVTLFHCYAGKDRTGLVAALLLRLAGATIEEVAADYALSGPSWEADSRWIESATTEEDRRRRTLRVQAPFDAMDGALRLLEERFGSVEEYLRGAGLDDERMARLRQRLAAA